MNELFYFIYNFIKDAYYQYLSLFFAYVPLSIIGVWRWGWWLLKKIRGLSYKPYENNYNSNVSVIIPVYMEKLDIFKQTLSSILANNPYEIICVIDKEDKQNIEYAKSINDSRIRVIITTQKGKRNALSEGIRVAKGEIIALIDSDVIWDESTLKNSIKPFIDKSIVGVCARQNAINRDNPWSIITDMFWDSRNHDDLPAMSVGKALSCLSGRTAFWRKEFLEKHLDQFLNEYIFNVKKESGEDKCWTRLALGNGYKVYFQSNAQIYSYATSNFRTFVSQRIRWSRNTFNSDLKSIAEGWVFKKPFLLLVMLDRFVSIFTLLVSPMIFILALVMDHIELAFIILGVWFIGRTIKHIQHISKHPKDIVYIPLYIFANFLVAFLKLYALITITEQKSIRGDNKISIWKHFLGIMSTIFVLSSYILLFIIWKGYI